MLKNRSQLFDALGVKKEETLSLVLKAYGIENVKLLPGAIQLENYKGESQNFTFPMFLEEFMASLKLSQYAMIRSTLDHLNLDYTIQNVFYMNEEEFNVTLVLSNKQVKDVVINFIEKGIIDYV